MFALTIGLILLATFAVILFIIIKENDTAYDRKQAEKELQRKLDKLAEKQQRTEQAVLRIEKQAKPPEVVEAVVVSEQPQKKVKPQPVHNDPPSQKPASKPQSKVESAPKQQPKPKTKPEPVKVTEVQESMFPEVPLEKGDEVTAILDSDGIYYIDNRKTSGIIWIPYTEDALPALYLLDDLFDIEFEERGAVTTKGYPAWRVMIR